MPTHKISWDNQGEKKFEAGTDRGVLYPIVSGSYPKGEAWNGLTALNENPEGGDAQDFYADNIKYGSLRGTENYGGTIECFTYPDGWKECDGRRSLTEGVTIAQQNRKAFGLSYRSLLGNDSEGLDLGYVIHLVYNATASPSQKSRSTINENPEMQQFSYEFKATPVPVNVIPDAKPTAHLEIDSTKLTKAQLDAIEAVLYGTVGTESYDEITPVGTENPMSEGWYERSGSVGAYVYTATTDTSVDSSKTYYVKTVTGDVDGRLPLPDEVYQIISNAA